MNMKVGGPQRRSGHFGGEKILLRIPQTEEQFCGYPFGSPVTTPPELSRLTQFSNLFRGTLLQTPRHGVHVSTVPYITVSQPL